MNSIFNNDALNAIIKSFEFIGHMGVVARSVPDMDYFECPDNIASQELTQVRHKLFYIAYKIHNIGYLAKFSKLPQNTDEVINRAVGYFDYMLDDKDVIPCQVSNIISNPHKIDFSVLKTKNDVMRAAFAGLLIRLGEFGVAALDLNRQVQSSSCKFLRYEDDSHYLLQSVEFERIYSIFKLNFSIGISLLKNNMTDLSENINHLALYLEKLKDKSGNIRMINNNSLNGYLRLEQYLFCLSNVRSLMDDS